MIDKEDKKIHVIFIGVEEEGGGEGGGEGIRRNGTNI